MIYTKKISPMSLGLAIGIVWGLSVFIMGIIAYYFSYGIEFVASMKIIYMGYEPSIFGSFVGGCIGFVNAFIAGSLIAVLYNFFSHCCCRNQDHCK